MRTLFFITLCMSVCAFVKGQDIRILPVKKVYDINRETAYCKVQSMSTDTLYYQVGLEAARNGKLIGQTEDVYSFLPTKVTKMTRFIMLKPKQTRDGKLGSESIGKKSFHGITEIIGDSAIYNYDFRFKVVYGKDSSNLNQMMHSDTFKISNGRN